MVHKNITFTVETENKGPLLFPDTTGCAVALFYPTIADCFLFVFSISYLFFFFFFFWSQSSEHLLAKYPQCKVVWHKMIAVSDKNSHFMFRKGKAQHIFLVWSTSVVKTATF